MTTTASTQQRPPLFDVEGSLWANNNRSVWTDDVEATRRVAETLLANGYELYRVIELEHGLYKFTYFDRHGKNVGRADGANEFVDLYFRSLSFNPLPYEVAYRLDPDGEWSVFQANRNTPLTWILCGDAEWPASQCRLTHPEAQVVIRPSLIPS